MFWGLFNTKPAKNAISSQDEKVKEGIDFALQKYGETLKDLARYDRGEKLSSEIPR